MSKILSILWTSISDNLLENKDLKFIVIKTIDKGNYVIKKEKYNGFDEVIIDSAYVLIFINNVKHY